MIHHVPRPSRVLQSRKFLPSAFFSFLIHTTMMYTKFKRELRSTGRCQAWELVGNGRIRTSKLQVGEVTILVTRPSRTLMDNLLGDSQCLDMPLDKNSTVFLRDILFYEPKLKLWTIRKHYAVWTSDFATIRQFHIEQQFSDYLFLNRATDINQTKRETKDDEWKSVNVNQMQNFASKDVVLPARFCFQEVR